MTVQQEEASNKFLASHPDIVARYNKLETKSTSAQKTNSTLQVTGSATPLTDYYMYFVAENYDSSTESITNYELVDDGRLTTENDFNGTIYVGTVEIGYGNEGTNFNETLVNKYDDILLDFNGDNIVDEFIDVWKVNNVTSGKFTSVSTSMSMNSSGQWPSYTASINIL